MKKRRGRPKGKKYPQPRDIFEGLRIASYGKLGASQAWRVILVCPYPDIDRIERIPPGNRTRQDREILKRASEYLRQWNHEIGTVVGQRIVARDHDFFRQLADAIEELSKADHLSIDKDRRHLALQSRSHPWAGAMHHSLLPTGLYRVRRDIRKAKRL